MQPTHDRTIAYRPEIDGLRAVAVVPVIFFHAGFEAMAGGFVGVDIFFVISGYLITSILYSEIQNGGFSLARFYERRVRRLYPALTLVTLFCIPFAWWWMLPSEFREFLYSIAAIQLFASNIYFWWDTDYFSTGAELTPLLHTWSLAVEEQFYLFFPLGLLLVRQLDKRLLIAGIVLAIAAGILLATRLTVTHPSASFYLLPSRAWELLTGALLALTAQYWSSTTRWLSETLSLAGLALIVIAVFTFDAQTPFPGIYALAPVMGTALIIGFADHRTGVGKLLALPPVVLIGLMSYSAYLWHQPLFAFARIRTLNNLDTVDFLGLIVLTFVLAYLSWRYVESPFRERRKFPRKTIFAGALAFSATLFMGTVFASFYPAPIQMHERKLTGDQLRALELVESNEPKQTPRFDEPCNFARELITPSTTDRILKCRQTHGPGLAILGDSHGMNVFNALSVNMDDQFIVGFLQNGCIPYPHQDRCQYQGFRELLQQHPDLFHTVIFNEAGFYLLQTPEGRTVSRAALSEQSHTGFVPNERYIDGTLQYLQQLEQYSRVVWLGPWTEPHILPREYVLHGCESPPEIRKPLRETFEQLDDRIADTAQTYKGIDYRSSIKTLNLSGGHQLMDCQNLYFRDGDHWTIAGELRFGKVLKEELGRAMDEHTTPLASADAPRAAVPDNK
ncbi:MAG: acyltransferase family protein [Pseudomonas profundi]|uniref:acyltransferase family protein n=1 Tax=Pseudomonas profundi TaxID=1981513 RepID=UPI0030037C9C